MDSPKCVNCLRQGRVGQTYRVAGTPRFECRDCGVEYHKDYFDPKEFDWKTDFDGYKKFLKDRYKLDVKDRFLGNWVRPIKKST